MYLIVLMCVCVVNGVHTLELVQQNYTMHINLSECVLVYARTRRCTLSKQNMIDKQNNPQALQYTKCFDIIASQWNSICLFILNKHL